MLDVYWLEQTQADVPLRDDWLSTSELIHLRSLRFRSRRADWLLGRWTAKRAQASYMGLPDHASALAGIEIRPAPCGAPEVFFGRTPANTTISISHRGGHAICAVAPQAALGCDLEIVEPRSDAFISDYFSPGEQALIHQTPTSDRTLLLALLWSAKESTLKALRTGLRLDTRSVTVSSISFSGGAGAWRPLQVRYGGGQCFDGWWQSTDSFVRTLVSAPSPAPPIRLEIPASIAGGPPLR